MMTKKSQKIEKKYFCECCNYTTSKKYDYNKHLTTRKHEMMTKGLQKNSTKEQYICSCGKEFKQRQNLYRHKKKCNIVDEVKIENHDIETINIENNNDIDNDIDDETNLDYKSMFVTMMKKNDELQKTIVDMIPKLGSNNTTTTNKVNLNIFLNEHCKDALNINDFVNNLQIQLSDLENTGRVGFIDGISQIFVNGLQQLEMTKRPIHCSDLKREILYVKENDTWQKEDNERTHIVNAINTVKHNNMRQIEHWKDEHPECLDAHHPENDTLLNIVSNSVCTDNSNVKKIIKNIAKEVIIE
tara:strand:- start:36 stop:935 length:900 start_codon:yes stop_codon:yes gene_type:complete